jgi:hypothetical protein
VYDACRVISSIGPRKLEKFISWSFAIVKEYTFFGIPSL